MTGVQVHQLQQDDDPAVLDSQQVRQGSGRLCRHVLHLLPRFRPAWLPAFRQSGRGVQQLFDVNVRTNTIKCLSDIIIIIIIITSLSCVMCALQLPIAISTFSYLNAFVSYLKIKI